MMTWQHPSSAALPAKQRPDTTPTSGTLPLERAEQGEGLGVESGHDRHVGVAGASAAALGEEHDREAQPLDELEEAVLLAVVHLALGAGQDGVVVRQDGAAGPVRPKRSPLTRPMPATRPSAGRVGDEVFGAAARPLGRDDEAAVLLEGAVVAQVLDVLPGRAAASRVPALGGGRAALVEGGGDPGAQLVQLGPATSPDSGAVDDARRSIGGLVDLRPRRSARARPRTAPRRPPPPDGPPPSRRGGLDDVLHLHGLEHDEDGPGRHPVAGARRPPGARCRRTAP